MGKYSRTHPTVLASGLLCTVRRIYWPLPAPQIQNLDEWYRVELTYTSNAIEGNTLTRDQTALVVDKGMTIKGKSLIEHLEAKNHAEAVDYVRELASHTKPIDITVNTLQDIHRIVLRGIDDTNAGGFRTVPIRVSGSRYIFPNYVKVPDLMSDLLNKLHENAKTMHPCTLAGWFHYEFVTIHPFYDGNGRTARLLMNLILEQFGYPPAIIRKEDRLVYINAIEQVRFGSTMDDFYNLIYKAVGRSFDIYLDREQNQPSNDRKLLKIGDIARLTDEPVATIRYWTENGLLKAADITQAGYRLYDRSMIERVKEVRRLQQQRFTLAEIKQKVNS